MNQKENVINWTEIFNWLNRAQESLKQAQINLKKGWFAAAISRSYYVRFYAAHAALLSQGVATTLKTHGGLQSLFSKYLIKTNKLPMEFSADLGSAFELKQDADYKPSVQFHFRAAYQELKKAERFLNTVTQFLNAQKPEVEG